MRRPSPALVVALISLFVSLSGVVYAAATIGSAEIKNNSIKGKDVRDNKLTGADINEDTLGKVPSGAEADHAANADKAKNADNATNAVNAVNATTALNANTADTADTATTATTAETANAVAPLGVTTAALANQSIVGTKIKFPVIHDSATTVLAANGGLDTATAVCGGGERMIGGGGQFTGSVDAGHMIVESYPDTNGGIVDRWTVRALNTTGTATPMIARVVCIPDN